MICFMLVGITACGNRTVKKDIEVRFENSMFLGDSITEGFAINEILPRESVLAGAGATAGFIYEDIDKLVEQKPENIFIMLGSIDILMPVADPKELFRSDLTKLINKIKDELPDSNIYLQSITPVTEEALEQEHRYDRIEEYNKVLKRLTDELSVSYVDVGILAQKNPALYAEDGIHFKKEFYLLWLEKLSELM